MTSDDEFKDAVVADMRDALREAHGQLDGELQARIRQQDAAIAELVDALCGVRNRYRLYCGSDNEFAGETDKAILRQMDALIAKHKAGAP